MRCYIFQYCPISPAASRIVPAYLMFHGSSHWDDDLASSQLIQHNACNFWSPLNISCDYCIILTWYNDVGRSWCLITIGSTIEWTEQCFMWRSSNTCENNASHVGKVCDSIGNREISALYHHLEAVKRCVAITRSLHPNKKGCSIVTLYCLLWHDISETFYHWNILVSGNFHSGYACYNSSRYCRNMIYLPFRKKERYYYVIENLYNRSLWKVS